MKSAFAIALVALSLTLKPMNSLAQVTPVSVTISVMPPYTTSLYDYINTPNKIMVTLIHTQMDYPDLEIYLKASIKSENGISITTEPGYKPSEPIFLGRGKSFILNNQNIADAFNLDHTIIKGAELNELLNGAGLPEDYYQICIQVYDFNTDQLLSGDDPIGCSSLFNTTNLEPPLISYPVCGETVAQSAIQLVNISWTIPIGTLPGTLYHFEMVEIPENSSINPNEAFETSAFPPFYEETTTLNTLMLTVQKVVLSPGYIYAFRIRAEDPKGNMHFRNGGISEVCSFIYGTMAAQADMSNKQIQFISPKDCSTDSILLAMPPDGFYTGWRVLPFDKENYKDPLEGLPECVFRVEFFDSESATKPIFTTTTDKTFYQSDPAIDNPPFVSGQPYWIQVSIENSVSLERLLTSDKCGFRYVYAPMGGAGLTARTLTGSLQYRFENQGSTSYAVANSEIRLKCLYLLADKNTGKQYEIPEADVIATIGTGGSFPVNLSVSPVASTVTAANGNFTFHYSWPDIAPLGEVQPTFTYTSTMAGSITGKLERAMRIEIINPYYSTPQTVVMNNITPFDMGEVTTFVYSYELNASLTKGYAQNLGFKEDMVGKTIYVFRKQKLPGIPPFEGERLSNFTHTNMPAELKSAGYYLVASEKTVAANNDKGESVAMATFPRLIENLVTGDEYYWYAEGANLGSAQPLSFSNDLGNYYFQSNSNIQGLNTSQPNNQSQSNTSQQFANTNQQYANTNQQQSNATQQFYFQGNQQQNYSAQGNQNQHLGDMQFSGNSSAQFESNNSNYQVNNSWVTQLPGTSTLETSDVVYSNQGTYNFKVSASLNVLSNDPPKSVIKGRLVYEFPGKAGNARPLGNRKISVVSCLVTNEPGQVSKIVKNNQWEENGSAFPWDHVLFTSQTDANGNFNFQFPNIEPEDPDPTNGSFYISTGKLNRTGSWISWESDPEKNFRIVYANKSVKVKRVLRLVVDDPTGLFMSPDDNLEIDPLATVDVGTLTSNVMSYSLNGEVYGMFSNPNYVSGKVDQNGKPILDVPIEKKLQGVECYVLRKKTDIDYYQLPSDEGQNIVGTIKEYPDFKIVGMTTSNSEGKFDYDNILFRNSQAPIYLYFKTKEMLGDANFKPKLVNQNCINPFARPVFLFNSDYDYTSITGFGANLEPRIPTIKGKVTSNVNAGKGVKYATVIARFTFKSDITNNNFNLERTCITDTAGYYDFAPFFEAFDKIGFIELIQSIQIEVKKSGFHYMAGGIRMESYINNYDKSNFELGKQKIVDVFLYGNGNIKGRIVNEQGNPVDAYVQFLESRLFNTLGGEGTMSATGGTSNYILFNMNVKGTFEIPAIPGANRKLVIIPKDVAYFSDTINGILVSDNSKTDLGDIKVYERTHRISFNVKSIAYIGNNQATLPVKGAKISLIGSPTPVEAIADEDGKVTLSFKNVSESNLSVRVSGPTGSNFVPKVMSFTNFESEKVVQLPTVYLERGITLKGKILLDGKPTSDAEVYVELKQGSQTDVDYNATSQGQSTATESQYLFKAYPKADGTFEITTIPPELNGKQILIKAVYKKLFQISGKSIEKSATPESRGNNAAEAVPTIVGDEKLVAVPDVSGNLVLNLKTFDKMHILNVWGFPIEITKIQPQSSGEKVYVSGRVKLDGFCPGFDPLEPLTLEISNVLFAPSSQIIDGKPVGIPVQTNILVSTQRGLKLKYAKAFNVQLKAPNGSVFTISKDANVEGKGKLNAMVSIVDNSFQYPSSYLNFNGVNFNFCTMPRGTNPILNPVISVFNSSTEGNGSETVKYNLCNLSGQNTAIDLKFKFINFETVADAFNSTIEGTEISLAATLKAKVKDAGEVEVKVPKLVLKNNAIAAVSGDTPLIIELKDGGIYNADKTWKFEASNWRIDPKEGGVMSENCILHTGSINIPFSYFNLRSDFAYIGEPQTSNINIGGYPITFTTGAKVATGYNASCGGDKKGHWQLIFYPPTNGAVPAKVYNLPNINNVPLELETVSLLSNGENVFTIGTAANKMKLYNTVFFKPQSVFSLTDGFVLSGAADFHIPRVRDGVGVRLIFAKNAPVATNPKFDPIDLGFDGKGNIKFDINPTGQKFDQLAHTFTTYGFVQEAGVLNPVQVKMTYFDNPTVSQIKTEIVESPLAPNQTVKIGEQNTYLEKVKCKTKADQSDWDFFVFEGDLAGAKGVSAESNKHMVFTVHGEIKAEQDGFKADGISTPFGGIQITYQKGRLIGTLNMTNVPLGSALVTGVANLLMDSDGWAFYSNCRASGVPAPDACTLYMGILIGNYPLILPEMKSTVLQYAVKKEMPATFDKGLKGFYMIGGRELPIAGLDIGIDVVVASAFVRVPVAALDASFFGNFANGETTFGLGLTGGIIIEFGLGSITCTDLYGSGSAIAYVTGAYSNGSFLLDGGADFSAGLTVSQGIPYLAGCIDAVDISVSVSGGFKFSASPFNVNFYLK